MNSKTFRSVFIKILLSVSTLFLLVICTLVASVYFGLFGTLPNESTLENISQSQSTIVFDSRDEVIGKFYILDRTSVQFGDLPDHLVHALIATEDQRFYSHKGVDYRSLLRVLIKTMIMRDRSSGGGSTLSQQLAKNLFPREKSGSFGLLVSKIKEVITASRIERVYSKDEILTLYLNTVSFPDNVYGIESASRRFYRKSVSKLELDEAATLIGSLKATYTYNPRLNPHAAQKRRNVVLNQMVKNNYLDRSDYEKFKKAEIQLFYQKYNASQVRADYFLEQVRLEAGKIINGFNKASDRQYNLYTDGLKIKTTLDLNMQQKAEEALKKHMSSLQKSFENNWGNRAPWIHNQAFVKSLIIASDVYKARRTQRLSHEEVMNDLNKKKKMTWFSWSHPDALVEASSIDSLIHYIKLLNAGFLAANPKTGAIKSWVGGIDFDHFKYDHVNQSKRQVGSTFKPFVYAAALEAGVDPCEHISGKTITYTNYNNWTPRNGTSSYDDKYLSMQAALSKSVNTVAVKLMERAGVQSVIDLAQKAGVISTLPKVPSLALGTAEMTMLELAQAYGIFLNEGSSTQPYFIESITGPSGEIIYENIPEKPAKRVISEYTYEVMQQLMKSVASSGGTASRLRWKYNLTQDILGKTGTTQSNRDGWFVGLTPELLTVSWVGSDSHSIHFKDTSYGQGANSALPLFALFYQSLTQDPSFGHIVNATFEEPSLEIVDDLNCEALKEKGFLESLFSKEDLKEKQRFDSTSEEDSSSNTWQNQEEKEDGNGKKGIFKKIKKLFKKDK